MTKSCMLRVILLPGVIGWMNSAMAEEVRVMREVTVIGSKENVERLPGSGEFLDRGDIANQSYDDINRVLRKVPGVYVREEDGHGLFPNISLRGVSVGRSSKVTLMEDSVPTAPAPYSSPAAYYAPAVGRMDGVEVLKGSSQIKYGPHTSGGVVNYLSTPIPADEKVYGRSMFGTDGEIRNHVYYGATRDTDAGRFGYLVEYYDRQTDGFKAIDATPDFTDTDRTGFHKREPMLKLSWEPNTDNYQLLEFKIGCSDKTAYETYMGLADPDFKADSYRRYAGSRFDVINSEHLRSYLRYHVELSPDVRLTTTAYYNDFKRNWFKENSNGGSLGNPAKLAVLKGEAAGELIYRNNNREYYSGGIESVLAIDKQTGEFDHAIEVGVRVHQDQHSRFQRDDVYVQTANGTITERINGIPGGAGNLKENAEAIAIFAQDAITRGAWTIVPGFRYEHVKNEYRDYDTKGNPGALTAKGEDTLDIFAPGIGAVVNVSEQSSFFGGVYRGFSVPEPRAHVKDGIEEETSTGYELGYRFNDRKALNAEVALFYTDFNDLIVPALQGAGGGDVTENVGDIHTGGVEAKVAYDLGVAQAWGFSNPWYVAATWTQAELDSDTASRDAGSIFSGGREGAKVPYVPEWQFLVGSGLDFDRWGIFLDIVYVDETFTTASNTSEPVDASGNTNYSYGKTDSYTLVDVSGYLQLKPGVRLVGSVSNLFDEEYLASRHPAGARPGKSLTALAGLEFSF
jgi:Fe(3+) dicitrate transport protein